MRPRILLLATFLAIPAGDAAAQSPAQPANVYVTCFGPVPGAAEPRPAKVYFSGVSIVPVTLSNQVEPAFVAYARQKYGADFDPRCDFSSTETGARDYLKAELNVLAGSAVETGWVWTAPTEAPAKPPQRAPQPRAK